MYFIRSIIVFDVIIVIVLVGYVLFSVVDDVHVHVHVHVYVHVHVHVHVNYNV